MCYGHIVWMPQQLHTHFIEEADRIYKLETGGALMGRWHDASAVVITAAIGAGPGALHERYNFEPDQEWQVAEIAKRYEATGRRETYLGDWHTHPDAKSGHLSRLDRAVLRRIIISPAARAQNPLMMILYGTNGDWQVATWLARLEPRLVIWSKLMISQAELRLY